MIDAVTTRPDIRFVPLALIDPPELTMRETFDPEGMAALVDSLMVLGQLQNLVVVVADERFRVAAGHRRRVAMEIAGFVEAHCRVFAKGTSLEEAAKVDENDQQERVNPAAEATYYRHLLDSRCGGDVEQLCRLVRRRESHVLDRLDLTRGDPAVLAALRDPSSRRIDSPLAAVFPDTDLTRVGSITLAVARELNKVKDARFRALFLHDAIKQGSNATVVRRWREEQASIGRYNEAMAAEREQPTPASDAAPIVSVDACPLCHSDADQFDMEYVKVHRSCRAVFARQQSAGDRPRA